MMDAKVGLAVFDALGFKSLSDQNKDQVRNRLLPAFGMDPVTSVINHIRLCSLPKDLFVVTIMEWITPISLNKTARMMNSLTISVPDVNSALQKAEKAGMVITQRLTKAVLPVFGEVMVGTALVEEGCNCVTFCCFDSKGDDFLK